MIAATERTRSTGARRLLTISALALVGAACAGSEDDLTIGIKRVAIDLAFKDADKAPPPAPPRVIRRVIRDQTEVRFAEEAPLPRRRPRPPIVRPRSDEIACPTAPPTATPDEPAFHIVREKPTPGSWPHVNTGAVEINFATFSGKAPLPPQTRWRVTDVREEQHSAVVRDEDADELGVPGEVRGNTTAFPKQITYTQKRQISRTVSFEDTFMYEEGEDYLLLIRRVIRQGGNTSEFNPTPPIRYIPINQVEGEGEVLGHGGTDRENNIAMVVQSKVLDRQWVDVCGEVIDTYRIEIRERYADLSENPPVISGNNAEDPESVNYWFVQYHNGILVAKEDVNTTIRTSVDVGGAPVPLILNFDYTSKIAKVEPDPADYESVGL